MSLRLEAGALLRRALRFAFVARADLAKPLPRVDSVVVPVAEHELNAVAPDVIGFQDRQVFGDRSRVEYAKPGYFAYAVCAHAFGAKVLDRKQAHMTVVPANGYLAGLRLLYLEWNWGRHKK